MDEAQPPMRASHGANKRIRMRVLIRSAQGRDEERERKKPKGGEPGAQGVSEKLQEGAHGEDPPGLEGRGCVAVREGAEQPAGEA